MPLHVISDLHIGAGELDDCDPGCEAALVAFIDGLASGPSGVELVLNGDSFDFVQADPWRDDGLEATAIDGVPLCFTRDTSRAKARSIVAAHPAVFDALGRLVRRDGARLTILPGNHDADLYWDDVRELIIGARIHGGDAQARQRLHWHLDRVYRPARAPHVWIEHGHQFDPINQFVVSTVQPPIEYWGSARPPIVHDATGRERLLECLGTRFLLRFLNGLDARYPFVDNIKPMSKFFAIFRTSALRLSGGTARAALSALAFMRFVGSEALLNSGNLLALDVQGATTGAQLRAIDEASGGAFAATLQALGCDTGGRSFELATRDPDLATDLLDFALAHLDALDTVPLSGDSLLGLGSGHDGGDDGDDGMLSLRGGLTIDETQLLRDAASDLLKQPDCRCVIMGHTHETVDEPQYKNTGSWTRYWQMSAADAPSWEDMLARSAHLPMSLRHARVPDEPDQPVVLEVFTPPA